MNIERLQKLVDLLKQVPQENLDLTNWGSAFDEVTVKPTMKENLECGYSACAIGWACIDKEFNEEGLTYNISDEGITPATLDSDGEFYLYGWPAIRKFFDLPEEISLHLFADWEYNEEDYIVDNDGYDVVDINAVIERIEKIIYEYSGHLEHEI